MRSRAPSRCTECLALGHDRRICPTKPPAKYKRVRDPEHRSDNAGYQANRAKGLCDDCGRPSKLSRCAKCRARRKLAPSRDGKNPRVIAQRKRWRQNAKARGSRWT